MFPLSPSNPSSADLYSVLHLEALLSEVEQDRSAALARPRPRPTRRALGAFLLRPLDDLAARLDRLSRLGRLGRGAASRTRAS
jgi:hypothetical protein